MDYQQQTSPQHDSQIIVPATQASTGNNQLPVAPASNTQSQQPKKSKLPSNVKLTLLIFTLVSAFVLSAVPHLSSKTPNMPSFGILLISGLVMVLLTVILFSVLNKLNLGFGKTALIMALGYNAVVAIIKFVISPRALYLSNQNNPFSTQVGDPNTIFYYILTGVVILLLYVGVFRLIYGHFRKRIEGLSGQAVKYQHHFHTKGVVLFSIGAVGLVAVGGGVILLPLFFVGSSAAYLGYVFSALGIPLVLAIVLAIFMAYRGFAAVEKQVLVSGNTALLASFLWLGVSLIILYHILWIVFMLTLVHIWPFNTYSPK